MKIKKLILTTILLSVLIYTGNAQSLKFPLTNSIDSLSYCVGLSISGQMSTQGVSNLNAELVAKAISNLNKGEDPLILPAEANQYLNSYFKAKQEEMQKANQAIGAKNLEIANEFLEKNKKKAGITTLPSGLQYEIIKTGSGLQPKKGDKVSAHYSGTLIDGQEFDSSVKRGQPFSVNVGTGRVIKGWDEILLLMKEGDKWRVFIPPALGYGANPRPGGIIKPNDLLIFEMELLSVEPATQPSDK